MRQILQNLKDGKMTLEEVPPPKLGRNGIIVCTRASVISAGTERMVVDLAKKSLIQKAQDRPDLVKRVLEKLMREGFASTYRTVNNKLSESIQLGYSASGTVVEVGSECSGFYPGDRVAMAGAGYANHAEFNYVPKNLVAKIPHGVSFENAAYTTVASIAMQGLRLAEPTLGDTAVVVGLGLIGLISIQLLAAAGCKVLGFDVDLLKVERAKQMGAYYAGGLKGAEELVAQHTDGRGCDLVLITAGTKSNGPIELAGAVTRRRARVVVVGAVGMSVPRDPYFKKELDLKISMSYGPGRYDRTYEEDGNDYPYEFVRWTENRNMQSVLQLMEQGKLDVGSLTTHRFDYSDALRAYDLLQSKLEYLGIVLNYSEASTITSRTIQLGVGSNKRLSKLGIGFVGAGGYASVHLLPHIQASPFSKLKGLACSTGSSARNKAAKFGFDYCTTDAEELFGDSNIQSVFIATRHDTHSSYTISALQAGKSVFVEKPIATSIQELSAIEEAYVAANASRSVCLMVGTNRRFSPMVRAIKEHLCAGPVQMQYRINPGPLARGAWFQDASQGGGMLVSEVCHFVDVLRFLAGSPITKVYSVCNRLNSANFNDLDNILFTLSFSNGSIGTIGYNTVGPSSLPKELLQVFGGGRAAVLTDFKTLELSGDATTKKISSASQDKGQRRQIEETLAAFKDGRRQVIPISEIFEVMRAVFAARESLDSGRAVELVSEEILV